MRVVSRDSSVASNKRAPRSSIPRARTSAASARSMSRGRSAAAMSSSVAASSSSTGLAASRRIRSGSAGRITAATASATIPPVSASSARAKEKPWPAVETVKTSTAETATWLTNSWLVPKNTPRPIGDEHGERELRHARSELGGEQVGGGDPERDRGDELDRAPAALVVGGPERDHGRDRGEERARVPEHPLGDRPRRGDRDAGLHHRAPARRDPVPAGGHGDARALRGALEEAVRDHSARRYSTRSSPSSGSENAARRAPSPRARRRRGRGRRRRACRAGSSRSPAAPPPRARAGAGAPPGPFPTTAGARTASTGARGPGAARAGAARSAAWVMPTCPACSPSGCTAIAHQVVLWRRRSRIERTSSACGGGSQPSGAQSR